MQFLDQEVILDRYMAFLRKIEKGRFKWGSEEAMRDLHEALRFWTFTSLRKNEGKQQGGGGERDGKGKRGKRTMG